MNKLTKKRYYPSIHSTWRLNLLKKLDENKMCEVIELSNEIISKEYQIDDNFTREAIIAREINVTTWESFCRFGDRKCVTQGLCLCWIRPKGIALDVQALFMDAEYGIEISPEELAQFIIDHPNGKSSYTEYSELKGLKHVFYEQTGFHWNIKFAREFMLKSNSNNSAAASMQIKTSKHLLAALFP